MDANERFEKVAKEFFKDTGYMAPGKDVPTMVATEEYDTTRQHLWKIWCKGYARGGENPNE